MPEIFKFPFGGYDVKVYRKQDILDCIEENIVDKEIALEIIKQCEIDATNFLLNGKWTGLPHIGNIRIPKATAIHHSPEVQALIKNAEETLTHEKYVMFRKQLRNDTAKAVARERYYEYIVSKMVTKNRKLFRKLCDNNGDAYARFLLYTLSNCKIVSTYD